MNKEIIDIFDIKDAEQLKDAFARGAIVCADDYLYHSIEDVFSKWQDVDFTNDILRLRVMAYEVILPKPIIEIAQLYAMSMVEMFQVAEAVEELEGLNWFKHHEIIMNALDYAEVYYALYECNMNKVDSFHM